MKRLDAIREKIPSDYEYPEAYAQYVFRTNTTVNPQSYFEFICARAQKKKIAKPLNIVQSWGGV